MKLSILIPAHNEEKSISGTIIKIMKVLKDSNITYEIIIINDNSSDNTKKILKHLLSQYHQIKYFNNTKQNGFGLSVRMGLECYTGDAVVIVMADGSDHPEDIIKYYHKIVEGYDCVFGSRFIKGGSVLNYPLHKLILNRMANFFIKLLFLISYNDTTNAFKAYKREVIDGLKPLLSHHFNLTVELPLKAIIRGYSYTIIPISWVGRKEGVTKFRIKEMGSRYLFIIFHVLREKLFSRNNSY